MSLYRICSASLVDFCRVGGGELLCSFGPARFQCGKLLNERVLRHFMVLLDGKLPCRNYSES
jgi:hypothetical protein